MQGDFGEKTFLVVLDPFSKWLKVHTTASTFSSITIEELTSIFATHGLAQTRVSDNATSFKSADFQHFV